MRFALVLAAALLGVCSSATAQISIQVGLPSVRIGVRLGGYPDLVAVPGYPVYYAPQLDSNLFFYDGLYWVYAQDRWYSSTWYDGPWDVMDPAAVPYFVLRVPVQYYRQPPVYFTGWARDAPPRWGEHWGRDWEQHHGDWDRWDRRSAPAPAPLPTYQRQYSGDRYPDASQQRTLRESNYRYQPHEAVVRQQYSRPAPPASPAPGAGRTGHAKPGAPAPAAPHTSATPERTTRGDTAVHTETRPATAAPAPRNTEAASPHSQAPANREAQRPPADEGRGTPAPATHEAQRKPPEATRSAPPPAAPRPQGSPAGEQHQDRAPQPQHEAPAPRAHEPAEKPPAKAPEHEQKKEPEHERDH